MTLGSQMARTDRMSGSWGGSSRRRRPGPALTYGLAAAGVVLFAFVIWAFSGPSTSNAAEPGTGGPSTGAATPPTPGGPTAPLPVADPLAESTAKRAANPPSPAPPSVEMGRAADKRSPAVNIPTLPPTLPASTPAAARTDGPALVPTDSGSAPIAGPANTPSTDAARQQATPPTTQPPAQPPAAPTPSDLQTRFAAAERAMKENRLVDARQLLNSALLDPRTSESDREGLRRWMSQINDTLVFSPTVVATDPLVTTYTIASGDSLVKVAARQGVATDWRLIQRVNRLSAPNRINVGQKLKLVRGPFHAVVHKSAFRMDIFAGDPTAPGSTPRGGTGATEGADPGWIYIRSFPVGLGSEGSTPLGSFVVRPRSKLINPSWVNPRTGEKFAASDPNNPIGEYWLGLDGIDDLTRALSAYGVHGTIDPSSIGREMSMGCIRMADADVAIVYELLTEGVSVVRIVP